MHSEPIFSIKPRLVKMENKYIKSFNQDNFKTTEVYIAILHRFSLRNSENVCVW